MQINRDNIFNFSVAEAPSKEADTGKADKDVGMTNTLMSMLKTFDFGISAKANYILITEKKSLYMIPENGDSSQKHTIAQARECEKFVQSMSGEYLAIYSGGSIVVQKIQENGLYKCIDDPENIYFELPVPSLSVMRFSKTEKFLVIQTRHIGHIIDINEKKTVFSKAFQLEECFKVKSNPLLLPGEQSFYFFLNPNVVQQYEISTNVSKDKKKKEFVVSESPVKEFRMPKSGLISSAVMTKEDGLFLIALQSKIALITDNNMTPFYSLDLPPDSFHEAQVKMSRNLQHALILYTNYLDDSGKSYYGTNRLQLINTYSGRHEDVVTIRGPIHSITWNPNSEEFIAFSGHMPAHSVIYSNFGDSRIQIGILYANFAKWSPDSKFIAIGGFGSLDTGVAIYESGKLDCISRTKTEQATSFKWLKDSKRFLMAILYHKLKVSNCFRLYSVEGALLMKIEFLNSQLQSVQFSHYSKLKRQL
jgi:hypothetical protein